MSKDKPILFSAQMARALFVGRKTQTRRILKDPKKPPYSTGQRMWVRETWAVGNIYDGVKPSEINPGGKPGWCGIRYAATDHRIGIKDRPAIFMPRWASRLTLVVTETRTQKLHDISDDDIKAEGASDKESFALLWDHIHGKGAWDANPFVVALTFEVHRCNIDKMEPAP